MKAKKIVLVGNEKGGTGKSTVSVNLAVALMRAGYSVALVDVDDKPTSTVWAQRRSDDEKLPAMASCQMRGRFGKQLLQYAENFDVVIVDAGGEDGAELRQAALVADLWLVPLAPTHADLMTLNRMLDLCFDIEETTGTKANTHILLNKCGRGTAGADTAQALSGADYAKYMPVMPVRLSNLVDYDYSFGLGRSVLEYKKSSKAAGEVEAVAQFVITNLFKG